MGLNYRAKLKDFVLLFLTRIMRMFSYGMLSVVFFENLFDKSLTQRQASWLQSSIVFGDIIVSLILTTQADRIGRINTLLIGSVLKVVTGILYAESSNLIVLTISGILGVISVSGGEIGPFMPVEQSALSQLVQDCTTEPAQIAAHTSLVFGYYNMAGYISQAFGAVFAGFYIRVMSDNFDYTKEALVTNVVRFYALIGLLMFVGYFFMDRKEIQAHRVALKQLVNCAGLHKNSVSTIVYLSALFALDAFAGGFIVQSYLSYYYEKKYELFFDKIGAVLFVCNIISGISGVLSSKLVNRFGAMATMIYTHLPSNIFLLAIALVDVPILSILLLFGRFCISQMDVPARQTYVSMTVSSAQRSAANGITNIARSIGLCIGLGLNGYFMDLPTDSLYFSFPFLLAGSIKIVYDITIGCCFLWNRKKQDQTKVQGTKLVQESSDKSNVLNLQSADSVGNEQLNKDEQTISAPSNETDKPNIEMNARQ